MEGLRAGRQTDGSGWFDTVLRRTPARLTPDGGGDVVLVRCWGWRRGAPNGLARGWDAGIFLS